MKFPESFNQHQVLIENNDNNKNLYIKEGIFSIQNKRVPIIIQNKENTDKTIMKGSYLASIEEIESISTIDNQKENKQELKINSNYQ